MKTLRSYLVEKEWDHVDTDVRILQAVIDGPEGPKREKRIAFGYTNLERANKDVAELNKECANCPRRAALHTVYRVLPNVVNIRMITTDDTYKEKMNE